MPKTVLITGSSSGIGKATAIQFANEGWNVAATMRSPEKEKELTEIPNIKIFKLDVSDSEAVEKVVNKVIEEYKVIDVLVNNAGFGVDGVFEEIDDQTIEKQFNTNVFGLMRMTRSVIPHMRKNNRGVIIQIASMGGRVSFPLYSIYHATKWAVEGFTESLQYELEQFNIRLKIIEPGNIKTDFYGRSREQVKTTIQEYQQFVEKCEKVSQGPNKNGVNPEVVAKTIYDAALDTKKKLRYSVGYPAPQLIFLKRYLPEQLFYKIVKLVYRI